MKVPAYLPAALGFLAVLGSELFAQQQPRIPAPNPPPVLPANMDCEKLKGDKELPPNSSTTILKKGLDYYACQPKSEALLAKAVTAAVVVRSTQTITCGDGSTSDCIREDTATERQIEGIANKTDLWRFFKEAPTSKADIIIQFVVTNRADAFAQIVLKVEDSDSGTWPYTESRVIADIENDVQKLVDHFLATSNHAPIMSKEQLEKSRQCSLIAEQLTSLQSDYAKRRSAYEFKNSHLLDAQMDECNLHWKEWVCLKRGGSDGVVSYAEQWNESGQELKRKLTLEYEALKNMEEDIKNLSQSTCPTQ